MIRVQLYDNMILHVYVCGECYGSTRYESSRSSNALINVLCVMVVHYECVENKIV